MIQWPAYSGPHVDFTYMRMQLCTSALGTNDRRHSCTTFVWSEQHVGICSSRTSGTSMPHSVQIHGLSGVLHGRGR
eukprot:6468317-Amphidinium_carterae.2